MPLNPEGPDKKKDRIHLSLIKRAKEIDTKTQRKKKKNKWLSFLLSLLYGNKYEGNITVQVLVLVSCETQFDTTKARTDQPNRK